MFSDKVIQQMKICQEIDHLSVNHLKNERYNDNFLKSFEINKEKSIQTPKNTAAFFVTSSLKKNLK